MLCCCNPLVSFIADSVTEFFICKLDFNFSYITKVINLDHIKLVPLFITAVSILCKDFLAICKKFEGRPHLVSD